jgi:hypothetical protein
MGHESGTKTAPLMIGLPARADMTRLDGRRRLEHADQVGLRLATRHLKFGRGPS